MGGLKAATKKGPNSELKERRHEKIRARFRKLCNITTKKGKKAYTYAKIIEMLHEEFLFAEKTIENIISK
jgi:hypothetical protein